MSMHILPAYYTTTVARRKSKSKSFKKISDHDIWLLKKGLHPEQIKLKKDVDKNWKEKYNNDMMVDRSTRHYDNKQLIAGDCSKRDIMTNLHKEPEHVREEILKKASRVAPLYSKGGYQLITPETNLKEIGKKM
jgi:hypothetical protein